MAVMSRYSAILCKCVLCLLCPVKAGVKNFSKKKTDKLCCRLLSDYQPDLLLFTGYRLIGKDTIQALKTALPNTFFAGLYYDQLVNMTNDFIATNKLMDAFMATGAGWPLDEVAQKSGNIPCAFMPNCCDPDIERPYTDSKMPQTNIMVYRQIQT